jgi:hypothetical protein
VPDGLRLREEADVEALNAPHDGVADTKQNIQLITDPVFLQSLCLLKRSERLLNWR